MQGQCETNCQLFIAGKAPNEGNCAFLAIAQRLQMLNTTAQTIVGRLH